LDGLRWLLLLVGVLVVAGVYFYTRREREAPESALPPLPRKTPTLSGEPATAAGPQTDDSPESLEDAADEEPQQQKAVAAGPQKIVTLRVVARNKGAFKGDELILSLRGIGMRSGKFGIYHRYDGNDESKTIFSAASLVEPGSFDLANIKEQEIPGISIFMIIPGPIDASEAFDLMMQAARALAQTMDAELLDESGSTLSIQRERYMREEIIQFQHSNLVA
jgi:cell division protein ZipA